jgi:hypothetical protein
MWSKKIKRRGKVNGLKREIRVIWPYRDLKPLFVGEGMNLGNHMLKPLGDFENVSTI